MNSLITDIRLALRHLSRSPLFSFFVILTLALGIGATTAFRVAQIDPAKVLRSE